MRNKVTGKTNDEVNKNNFVFLNEMIFYEE